MVMKPLYKQIRKNFKEQLKEHGVTVNINYAYKTSDDGWGEDQLKGTYENVKVFQDVVKNSAFERNDYANIMEGKSVFQIPFSYILNGSEVQLDFKDKENITIEIIASGQVFQIDRVIPFDQIGDGFLCQLAVQA